MREFTTFTSMQGNLAKLIADYKLPDIKLPDENIWLIEEADGWVVIDTGPNTSKAKEQWLAVINNQLKGKPITRIICTHGHPDHIGLVGWLLEELEHKPSFSISMPDYKYYQMYNLITNRNI